MATSTATPVPVLPPAPEGVIIEQNVQYLAPDREERLDLYLPANRAKDVRSPAIVIIHGGGWTGGDKAAGREFNIGTNLAKAGYVCASVNYMLAPDKRWPTNVLDCKNAVRFLRVNAKRYQVDADHVGVIGGSAGGHLALMVAYTTDVPALEPQSPYPGVSDQVQCVVDLYGITDVITRQTINPDGVPTGKRVMTSALVKGTYATNPKEWELASPVYHVAKDSPPTLILHGTADTTVDREQASELARKLKDCGAEYKLTFITGIGHTFDLESWAHKPLPYDLRPVVIKFFDGFLKSANGNRFGE